MSKAVGDGVVETPLDLAASRASTPEHRHEPACAAAL